MYGDVFSYKSIQLFFFFKIFHSFSSKDKGARAAWSGALKINAEIVILRILGQF